MSSSSSCFPVIIRISSTGEYSKVDRSEDLPFGVEFRIVSLNASEYTLLLWKKHIS